MDIKEAIKWQKNFVKCGKRYEVGYEEYDYCPACGQKIKQMEVE